MKHEADGSPGIAIEGTCIKWDEEFHRYLDSCLFSIDLGKPLRREYGCCGMMPSNYSEQIRQAETTSQPCVSDINKEWFSTMVRYEDGDRWDRERSILELRPHHPYVLTRSNAFHCSADPHGRFTHISPLLLQCRALLSGLTGWSNTIWAGQGQCNATCCHCSASVRYETCVQLMWACIKRHYNSSLPIMPFNLTSTHDLFSTRKDKHAINLHPLPRTRRPNIRTKRSRCKLTPYLLNHT